MTELKLMDCPFCGGESELISDNDGHYVRCMCCAAEFKQATKEGAIKLWNRRAISREKILLELLGQDTEELGKEAIEILKARPQSLTEKVNGETSDGYHTFNELYEHRVLLWINLCLLQHPKMCYVVENHYDGWFLLGVQTPQGQLSYHCPNKYLYLCKIFPRLQPEWDGHSSDDVIKRLLFIAEKVSKQKNETQIVLHSTDDVDAKVSLNQASQEDREGLAKLIKDFIYPSGKGIPSGKEFGVDLEVKKVADAILKEYILVRREKND